MNKQDILPEIEDCIQSKNSERMKLWVDRARRSLSSADLKELSKEVTSLIKKYRPRMEKDELTELRGVRSRITLKTAWRKQLDDEDARLMTFKKKAKRKLEEYRKEAERAEEERRKFAIERDAITRAWSGTYEDTHDLVVKEKTKIIADSLKEMTQKQRQLWDSIRIVPDKWLFGTQGTAVNSFWVFGLFGHTAVWYNDLVDCFIASNWKERGVLVESKCSLGEFGSVIKHLDGNPTLGIERFDSLEEAKAFADTMKEFNMSVTLDGRRAYWLVKNEDVVSYMSPEEEEYWEGEKARFEDYYYSQEYGEEDEGPDYQDEETQDRIRELRRESMNGPNPIDYISGEDVQHS